ncbi:MAG: efflux transporter outer membrane subunit [Paramuribaculum sp.]|nr:efflux transporter outer membrane subunit [Paramuribaculum sp.]
MKKDILIPIVAAAIACAAVSCSAVRECKPVEMTLPAQLTSAADTACIADIEWWNLYGDPDLCSLIDMALQHNREFLGAAASVEQARQLYGASKANLLPEIGVSAYAQRETYEYTGKKFVGDPEIGVKATLSWEADLWGNLRWSKKGGQAQYQATLEDWRAMRISLIAETATAYFNLVALDNELRIVRRTLETRSEELAKAKLRYEGGLTSEIVYLQAQVEYNTAASLVPGLEKRIEAAQNALAVLTGEFPGKQIERAPDVLTVPLPQEVPVGLPSALLLRRPDLRASTARLAKATADVGVAYTDRFPRLVFSLKGGVENEQFANLFKQPFSFMAASLAGPLIDFGRRKRKYKAAVAAYDKARNTYEQAVLTAFQETADAIVGYTKTREMASSSSALRDAARKYVNLAHLQYTGGSISYLDVLDAQRRYFDAEVSYSNAVRDEKLALVTLYKALGGGWSPADLPVY